MMQINIFKNGLFIVLLIAVLFAGCGSSAPPVEFYTLNPISETTKKANTADAGQMIAIGIGPVKIPNILDRPQIVTRTGPNKLKIDEFHRWAGRLDENFARVLAENISLLLATDQVAVFPWETSFKPRYQVALDIRYFEGRWGQDVLLEVFWTVIEPEKRTTLSAKKSVIKEPFSAKDYETLILTKSRAVAALGRKIAQEIKNLQSR